MARTDKVMTYCIIEAPSLERQKLGIERIAKVMYFDAELQRDAEGTYPRLVLALNEDDATAIRCKMEAFEQRYMPEPSTCTHVALLQLVNPRDFEKVCAMDDWKKIPASSPKEPTAPLAEEQSPVSPEEEEDPLTMVRG